MRLLFLLISLLLLNACSTTVKGPISKRSYDIRVGCTDDMKRYEQERQKIVSDTKQETAEPVEFECPPEEKPEDKQ